jgi:hypothetical protein
MESVCGKGFDFGDSPMYRGVPCLRGSGNCGESGLFDITLLIDSGHTSGVQVPLSAPNILNDLTVSRDENLGPHPFSEILFETIVVRHLPPRLEYRFSFQWLVPKWFSSTTNIFHDMIRSKA